MNQKISIVTYNVFGTLDEKKYIKLRQKYIIDEIFKNNIPDVICLQEATKPIIDAIMKKLPKYFLWTKLDTIKKISDKDKSILLNDGYLVIISKWKFKKKNLIYKGSFYDDGILNVIVDSKNDLGKNISIYNVHTSGGTFGKSKEVKLKKQMNRINELKLLNKALVKDKSDNVLIMGDFNMDSNDIKHYPELKFSPEYKFKNIHDVWKSMKPKMIGATEDEFINTFRSAMKIKKRFDKRKARYDKILYKGEEIKPSKIKLIGNKKINKKVKIKGKNELGIKKEKLAFLFPSDHFGIYTEFKIKKKN
jgi:endonuclease/exonuclease/phosphatase family metal-dependent hydrolase